MVSSPYKMKVKPIIYTTSKDLEWVKEECEKAIPVMETSPYVQVEEFTVLYLDPKKVVPVTYIDSEGVRKIAFGWFETYLSDTAKLMGFNIVGYHFSKEERNNWDLDENFNGMYWTDSNDSYEFWVCADKGEWSPINRSDLPQFYRILLHEVAHGFTHFSKRREELISKYKLDKYKDDYYRLPTHYFDYVKRDIEAIFPEISFEQWSLKKYLRSLLEQLLEMLLLKKAAQKETEEDY